MHIQVVKQGIADTIQDLGRYGHQHLGISPGGVMDQTSARTANALVGNPPTEGVLELHFPAGAYCFLRPALVALTGADFRPHSGGTLLPMYTPLALPAGATIEFQGRSAGARCYLSVRGGFAVTPWLGSVSTDLKARAGGYEGRSLQKGDFLVLRDPSAQPVFPAVILPWQADAAQLFGSGPFRLLPGPEFSRLRPGSITLLDSLPFHLLAQSDRMGYRLKGPVLEASTRAELISSGVTAGCIELLPSGQVIILMADHPTTGGYPRIAHVFSADLPRLAQVSAGEPLGFAWSDASAADQAWWELEQHLRFLEASCQFRLNQYIAMHARH